MRAHTLACITLLAAACQPAREATLGRFVVRWAEAPASITIVDSNGVELLRTSGAPVASRQSSPVWESQFGSYKLTEDDTPWTEATTLTATASDGKVAFDFGGGRAITVSSANDGRLDLEVTVPEADNRLRAGFACGAGDHFLGFGSQADEVDHRGHKLRIWTSEPGIGKSDEDDIAPGDPSWMLRGTRHAASYPLPAFLSNRGAGAIGFVADTTRHALFDLCKADPSRWTVEVWDRTARFSLYAGSPAEVVKGFTADFGRQPRANDLALAPWNDAIFGSASVRQVAELLRANRIPSGLLWTEDFRGAVSSGENYRLKEEWDVDRALYPDVEELAKELHSKGFRWLAYHNTFLNSDTKVLEEARAAGVVIHDPSGGEYDFTGVKFEPATLVDLSHPQGPAFVTDRLKKLLSYGFDGWMSDYGEWLPPDAMLANGDAEAQHNDYPRQYFAAVAEAMKSHPDARYATYFTRSGHLRAAPLQPVVWAGDQWTNLNPDDGLPTIVTMGLNLGLGGLAIYGHDIAGYQNGTFGPSSKETFFRWTTVGALSPVMRTHHGTKAKTNWWFGKDDETIAHFRRWSRLHARLWPYLRAAADEAFETGMPIMRQLALEAPAVDRAWSIKDEYLFGPSLLVAPVLVEGATSRKAWLPPGTWIPFDGGTGVNGGSELELEVPLTEAAIFARAGSIIAMLPDTLDTLMPAEPPLVDLDDVNGERTLRIYGGASARLADVDGTSYALDLKLPGEPTSVHLDGSAVPACGGSDSPCLVRDAAKRSITVRGSKLGALEFHAGEAVHATFTTTGPAKVTELVYLY